MKTIVLLCLVGILALLPLGGVSAYSQLPTDVFYIGGGVWMVYPHNSSPDDSQRIQAAIDLASPGDTVRLGPGTFDFSDFEYVRIPKDLTLEGAWDNVINTPLTKIRYGFNPIMIGRKTPIEKPPVMDINGHAVTHITQDVWGKFIAPLAYVPVGTYNFFDDWTIVTVNVRQIAFERPYHTAIYSSAMNGGTIERIRIDSMWQGQLDFTMNEADSDGIGWYNQAMDPLIMAYHGRFNDTSPWPKTETIRGNLVVQDSVFNGDYRFFQEGELDEAGDQLTALYDPANPIPPNGDYQKYVLQDITFAWDDQTRPIPESIKMYWVKSGYTAYYNPYDGMISIKRGIGNAVYSLYAQSNLVIRRNMFKDCQLAGFFVFNGAMGMPFTALIEDNQIISASTSGWVTGFSTWAAPLENAFTGEILIPSPGENITIRNNTIQVMNPNLGFWESVIRITNYGNFRVENNRIHIRSGVGIISGWPTEGAEISGNLITGTGDYALVTEWANGNQFLLNNLRGFTPQGTGNTDFNIPPAQVLLLSDNNTVVARKGENKEVAWDLGQNNTVTGMIHLFGPTVTGSLLNAQPGQAAKPDARGLLGRNALR